jgi:hypothetical protein
VLTKSNSFGSSSPTYSLGNDNEDDYFGILPPLQNIEDPTKLSVAKKKAFQAHLFRAHIFSTQLF